MLTVEEMIDDVDDMLARACPEAGETDIALAARLLRLQNLLQSTQELAVSGTGLLWRDLRLLLELGTRSLSPKETSRRLGMSSSGVTPLIDRLESAGLIERVVNRQDRRGLYLKVTKYGREVTHDCVVAFIDQMPEIA